MADKERHGTGNEYDPNETHRSGHNADLPQSEGIGDRLGTAKEPSAEAVAAREQDDTRVRGGIAARLGGPTPAPAGRQPASPAQRISDVLDGEIDTADEISAFTSAGQVRAEDANERPADRAATAPRAHAVEGRLDPANERD